MICFFVLFLLSSAFTLGPGNVETGLPAPDEGGGAGATDITTTAVNSTINFNTNSTTVATTVANSTVSKTLPVDIMPGTRLFSPKDTGFVKMIEPVPVGETFAVDSDPPTPTLQTSSLSSHSSPETITTTASSLSSSSSTQQQQQQQQQTTYLTDNERNRTTEAVHRSASLSFPVGAIVGIAVGAFGLIVFIIGAAAFIFKRRNQQQTTPAKVEQPIVIDPLTKDEGNYCILPLAGSGESSSDKTLPSVATSYTDPSFGTGYGMIPNINKPGASNQSTKDVTNYGAMPSSATEANFSTVVGASNIYNSALKKTMPSSSSTGSGTINDLAPEMNSIRM